MPATPFDRIYRIIVRNEYAGQVCLNSFDYGCFDSLTASAADLLGAWVSQFQSDWSELVNVGANMVSASCTGIFGSTELAFQDIGQNGAVTGDGLPPYAAFSFVFTKAFTDSPRRGSRIAGVSESDQVAGVLGSTPLARMGTLAGDMILVLEGTDSDLYTPVVVRQRLNGNPVTPIEAWIPGNVVLASNPLSTQTSRKFGHGV